VTSMSTRRFLPAVYSYQESSILRLRDSTAIAMHWNELLGGCKCVWDFPVRTANRSQESGADVSGSAQCRVKLIVHFYYEMIRIRIAS